MAGTDRTGDGGPMGQADQQRVGPHQAGEDQADQDHADQDQADQVPDSGRSFEELVGELEAVTEQLAGGQIGIEQAADLYERAEQLHRLARERLEAVQARVDRLSTGEPPV